MRVLLMNHFPLHGSGTGTYTHDLATALVEAGLVGYEASSWQSIVAPAGLDPRITAALNAALAAILDEPATRTHFLNLGMQPMTSTPGEFGRYLKSEIKKWAPVIKAAGAAEE